MIKNDYWLEAEKLYSDGEEKTLLSEALREVLVNLREGSGAARKMFYQPDLIHELIKIEDGKAKITTSTLKHYVEKELIKKIDGESTLFLHDRLAIIYTQLTGYNKPRASMDSQELEEKLSEIYNDHKWPRLIEDEKTKKKIVDNAEDDYKVVANLISGTTASLNTFLFACAILGVRCQKMQAFFLEFKRKQNHKDKFPFFPIAKIGTGILAATILILIGVFVYRLSDPLQYKIRDKLVIESFLKNPELILGEMLVADSIGLHISEISFEKAVVQGDTIPSNECWIRLFLYNLSDSLTFYPDGLFMEPVLVEKFTSETVIENRIVRSQNDNRLILPERLDRLFEWQLISNTNFNIPARHFSQGLLKLVRNERSEKGIFHFQLSVDGYNKQSNSIGGKSKILKLAID